MLREEDLRIDIGRASHGGDFLAMTHIPTGKRRSDPGPLGKRYHQLLKTWAAEIEAELLAEGLAEFIVPDYPVNSKRQRKRS
jgi:hypothetical protein